MKRLRCGRCWRRVVILAAVILVITAPHRAPKKTAAASRTETIEAAEDPVF